MHHALYAMMERRGPDVLKFVEATLDEAMKRPTAANLEKVGRCACILKDLAKAEACLKGVMAAEQGKTWAMPMYPAPGTGPA